VPGLVGVLVALGMVVVVPLGLRRLETAGLEPLRRLWPIVGAVAALALLLPRGPLAVLLVAPYAMACAAASACGLRRLARCRRLTPQELSALTATSSLSVAALSLVAERAGVELLGFSLAVHGLTVAHFHFAGFAAALLAGLTAGRVPSRVALLGAVAVPVGTATVALGHFTSRWTELGGAVVLTVGLLGTSWVAARRVAPRLEPVARRLLLVACWATPITMLLAVHFALGRATGLPHLSIPETAATHGVLNALGVGLCGLLAWQRAGGARV
jgi:hypothetical protein